MAEYIYIYILLNLKKVVIKNQPLQKLLYKYEAQS